MITSIYIFRNVIFYFIHLFYIIILLVGLVSISRLRIAICRGI